MEPSGQRLIRYRDENATFSIFALADIHRGNVGCSLETLRDDIEEIRKDPYSLWVLLGDYADWISWMDKRFDPSQVDPSITVKDMGSLASALISATILDLEPIKGKCLGLGTGNHEATYLTKTEQQNIHQILCNALRAQNLMYSSLFDVVFQHCPRMKRPMELAKYPSDEDCDKPGSIWLRVLTHHGTGAANTSGGKINSLERDMRLAHADLVMTGHLHKQMGDVNAMMTGGKRCKAIEQECCAGMITGTYLRTYMSGTTSWGEKKGFQPAVLGATRATYQPATMVLRTEQRARVGRRI